ncbi:hypothetical protein SAMN02745194_02998 [Roseomonas rosea]|uniref:Uncharacterized protein n=1 Tax=Muricoccus roseus TaxID=198092 RepID=A0A1M6KVZ0_9PROT|nr:hypothetical protein [Roseomonas rosea]SHJ63135.1 hypothetical protein SAMN02745194_02998 [Roseomonas rosea]
MNRPLLVAVPAALLGFGGWVWLTGPGTSVPNALLALACAILLGRAGWWLAARRDAPEEARTPEASPFPAPGPGARHPPERSK